MKFNERLKELREKSKLTQEQLAKISGVSSRMIQRYEYGTSRPRLDAAEKLAKTVPDFTKTDSVSVDKWLT